MKTAVVLRHAERQDRADNGSHLSQAGIEQARRAAARFARFDLVVTSTLPRAVETAIAMGFAVNKTHPSIQDSGSRVLAAVSFDAGAAAWAAASHSDHLVRAYCDYVASFVDVWLDEVPDGGSLLVISHGGVVDAMAFGLSPNTDWATHGRAPDYVEGFVAEVDRGQVSLRPVRS
ncbi:MAG: histidine phosphatase family protein [Dehalococcoidia bacterium]